MADRGWLVGFPVIPGEGSGSWAGRVDAPKGVGHTTEGTSAGGAIGSFRTNRSWPHVTADPLRREKFQHVSILEAARALRNTSTPGETNRDGRTIQLEVVGRAASIDRMPDDALAWLGREVVGPMSKAAGIPLTMSVVPHPYPPENGIQLGREPWRLSAAEFDAYTGWLMHQHVPENVHGDMGAINFRRVLDAAKGEWIAPPWLGYLKLGSTGAEVAKLKFLLVGAGYGEGVSLKGPGVYVFGTGTRNAVIRAQNDLYRNAGENTKRGDGVVGFHTWNWCCDRIRYFKAHA